MSMSWCELSVSLGIYARFSIVTHSWLSASAPCVEFACHTSDKAAVVHPNLPERVDSFIGDVENVRVTSHVRVEGMKKK